MVGLLLTHRAGYQLISDNTELLVRSKPNTHLFHKLFSFQDCLRQLRLAL